MASQQKQEKIVIFNDRNVAKNKDIFNFLWQNKVTTNPRGLYGIIGKTRNKYLFLTTETWKKQVEEQGNNKPQTLSRSIWRHRKKKKKYLFLTTETWQKTKIFLIFHGRTR